MRTRRGFLGSIAALCAGAGVAPELIEQMEAAELDGGLDAVGVLVQCIHIHGAEATAGAIVEQPGPVNAYQVRRTLRQTHRRAKRARDASERRERHGGDEVLYRGPLRIEQPMAGQTVRSAVTRHRVLVGQTEREYSIDGIGVPAAVRPVREYSDLDGDRLAVERETVGTRSAIVPCGTRLVCDLRRGIADVMAAELVRTARGEHRLHLWQGATGCDSDGEIPRLRGGVVYETTDDGPRIGLLGMPL
jgi:hypothetical protein